MATWRNIAASETDPDSPVTSTLVVALAENPIALAEGASGAQRIMGEAAARAEEGAAGSLPVVAIAAADTYELDGGFVTTPGTTSTMSTIDVVAISYVNKSYTGSARFKATQSVSDPIRTSTLLIYKNNVLLASWNTSTSADRSFDVTLAFDDVIEWRHRIDVVAGVNSVVSNIAVSADDGYVIQNLYRLATS